MNQTLLFDLLLTIAALLILVGGVTLFTRSTRWHWLTGPPETPRRDRNQMGALLCATSVVLVGAIINKALLYTALPVVGGLIVIVQQRITRHVRAARGR